MLQYFGNGVYTITDESETYLEGDYNAETEAYIDESTGSPSALPEEVNGGS